MATPADPRTTSPSTSTSPAVPAGAAGAAGSDWTVQVADTIESVVGSIRDKTTVPVETIARGLVYGLLVFVMAIVALVLVTIALVRVLDDVANLRTWAVYLVLGGFFCVLGALLWAFRRPRKRG